MMSGPEEALTEATLRPKIDDRRNRARRRFLEGGDATILQPEIWSGKFEKGQITPAPGRTRLKSALPARINALIRIQPAIHTASDKTWLTYWDERRHAYSSLLVSLFRNSRILRPYSEFVLILMFRFSLLMNSRSRPAICLRRRRLCLLPWQHPVRSSALGYTHCLRTGEPFFGLLRNFQQQGLKLGACGLQDVWLSQPPQDFTSSHTHTLAGRGLKALVEVTDQHLFHHIPGIVRAKEPLDIF